MVGYSIDYEVIGHSPELGVVGHAIQVVKLHDPDIADISKVLMYESHDVVVGSKSRDDPPTYCLKIYEGMHYKREIKKLKIDEMEDYEADDFSRSTEGRISTNSILKVRNIMRDLQMRGKILRIYPNCVQCMRLEHLLKTQGSA